MENRLLKIGILTAALISSTMAAASFCPPYIVPWVLGVFTSSQASLLGFMNGVMGKIQLQNKWDGERTTSAIAILTKQKAIGSQKIMQAQTKSTELMARSYASLKQSERVKEARLGYGPEFGQGYDVCRVNATRNLLTDKWYKNDNNTISSMKNELDAPLGDYGSSRENVKAKLIKQFNTYCSADQEKMGVCKQTAQSNRNLQVATLFQHTAPNTPEHQAKIDYINQLVGMPDDEVNKPKDNTGNPGNAGNNSNGGQNSIKAAHYQLMKAQKDALNSPAIYSLKYIQNLYTKQGATSPLELLQYETKRYMAAGDDGQKWYKTMTTQHQRGLLLELIKLKSLDLNIQYKQYQQQGRTELILANLLAAEAQKLKIDAQAAN